MSAGPRIRLGAVGYLNARPLVYGLEGSSRFDVRYDVPSECARLLHAHEIDVGLIPSIEYLRGPGPYGIVPGPAVVSHGPVASVALYTTKPIGDVRSIALDTTSRTSVALVDVLCARLFKIRPRFESHGPDLEAMLARCDAALLIGDVALFVDREKSTVDSQQSTVEKIDLGEAWNTLTGLPFVYAFWAGWPHAITPADAEALQRARDEGIAHVDDVARECLPDSPERQAVASRYLRDNIRYSLGPVEIEGLTTFYQYATELGLVAYEGPLNFYHAEHTGAG